MAQIDHATRGRVLTFVARAPSARARARRGRWRPASSGWESDARLNADWDRLMALTEEACIWRDPESIAAVKAVLRRLERTTLREWYG